MRNTGLDEAQAGIKIAGWNINNLRFADDITLLTESEELKRLLMKVKEESGKVGLKLSIQKTKIMASGSITSWEIDGETLDVVADFIFGVCSNSCPLSWWWHPTISSSVAHFSSCSQSFPASGSFPMRQFFTSSGQSIGSSACIVSLSNEYSGLISFRNNSFEFLAAQGTLKSLLQHHNFKASILQCSAFFMVQLSYLYMTTGKAIALTTWAFVSEVLSLLFNMLSWFFQSFSSKE